MAVDMALDHGRRPWRILQTPTRVARERWPSRAVAVDGRRRRARRVRAEAALNSWRHRGAGGRGAAVSRRDRSLRSVSGARHQPRAAAWHWHDRRSGIGHPRSSSAAARGIHVEESITINKPVEQVYRFWRNFENLPKFMKHLDSVADARGRRLSLGCTRPGRHEGGVGRAHHQRDRQQAHRMAVARRLDGLDRRLGQLPRNRATAPKCACTCSTTRRRASLGQRSRGCFGEEPNVQISEDLHRFKQLMETGRSLNNRLNR